MLQRAIFFITTCLLFSMATSSATQAAPPSRYYYEIRIYHLQNQEQEQKLDDYLQHAFIPALHRHHISLVGVFKPVEQQDSGRDVYVLIPYSSWNVKMQLPELLDKDAAYQRDGQAYINRPYSDPVFTRMETILLEAFPKMPVLQKPALKAPMAERVYELRSYESPTEALNVNKVKMFNDGDEVGIFKRLNFNAVFYAEVLSGSHMPNLMYMTTFENRADREAHWKAFSSDPQWTKLSAMDQYQHNVSKAEITFLRPADYSDL